jgi:hypothetical protein
MDVVVLVVDELRRHRGSRLRRSIRGLGCRRRGSSSVVMHHCRRQYSTTSFAPVYIDELYYNHHHQPGKPLELNAVAVKEEKPTTALVAAATSTTTSTNTAPASARAGGGAMKDIQVQGGHAAAEPEVGGGVPGHAGEGPSTPRLIMHPS